MADDIVERLRQWDDGRISTHYEGCWDSHPVCAILLAADAIEARDDEIVRLRAAIDAFITEVDDDHTPEWASEQAKANGKEPWCCDWCGPQDGGWPCVHRMALDELKEARRG
jgi:ABC-type nitrate/sulfonate/bicarbonate transport system substrate-binding protein